jgi:hypothetical protein
MQSDREADKSWHFETLHVDINPTLYVTNGQILALFLRSMYYDAIITLCGHGHGCTDSKLRTPRGICMWDAIYI